MFKVQFDTDNAAFDQGDDGAGTCANILRGIAKCVDQGAVTGIIRDPNGNTVGSWSMALAEHGGEWNTTRATAADADSASMEELEAAGDMFDRLNGASHE